MSTYTIKEVMRITNRYYHNRFDYRDRDVLKRITIKEVTEIQRHDIPNAPRVYTKYVIESYSYPQYPPYYTGKDKRGRLIRYQRSVKHRYDVTLEIDRLSLNTRNWNGRVGSGKVWKQNPPQAKIKSLYPKTRRLLRRKANRRRDTQREKNKEYRKLVEKHKKGAPYLDAGDFNSQERGIMGDFYWRQAWAYHVHGHLFGRQYAGLRPSPITNPNNIVFFNKHQINVITQLMKQGILKND